MSGFTQILSRSESGDSVAAEQLLPLAAFAVTAQAEIGRMKYINLAHAGYGKRLRRVLSLAKFRLNLLATIVALLMSAQSLADEIVLRLGPGGAASLVNSSLGSSIILKSYSITRLDQGVELLPAGWDSFQRQGALFSETSAIADLLSEAAVNDGLLFSAGQSQSIGVPFGLRADADGDGTIDLTDFAIWKTHSGQPLFGPSVGDFDILLNEFGNSAVYTFDADTTIPEPASALLLLQHRGRLFLPFADDDPRTAEVISKVLLLARDQEI